MPHIFGPRNETLSFLSYNNFTRCLKNSLKICLKLYTSYCPFQNPNLNFEKKPSVVTEHHHSNIFDEVGRILIDLDS